MPNRLAYELLGPGEITIAVPGTVLERAQHKHPSLRRRLAAQQRSGYQSSVKSPEGNSGGQSFNFRLDALGKIAVGREKGEAITDITDTVSLLIGRVPNPDEEDERLSFSAFSPLSDVGDFIIEAELDLPLAKSALVAPFVQQKMTEAIRALQLYGPATESMFMVWPEVDIDYMGGVHLQHSTDSSVHTLGGKYVPGQRRVEVSGNNIERYGEPLVYLVGMVALAHADEYLTSQPPTA